MDEIVVQEQTETAVSSVENEGKEVDVTEDVGASDEGNDRAEEPAVDILKESDEDTTPKETIVEPIPTAEGEEADPSPELPTAMSQAVTKYIVQKVDMALAQAVANALADAVAQTKVQAAQEAERREAKVTAEAEEHLLEHIRAHGNRPVENGVRGTSGVRMHPAVDRLTRADRAMLAKRAEHGETIRF